MENSNKKSELSTETTAKKPMSTKQFAIRMILFTLFGLVLPLGFIIYRYDLFKTPRSTLTGFGLLAVIIAFAFLSHVLKMYRKANEHTLAAQIIRGYSKVIVPLVLLLYLVMKMSANIDYFIQALECLIISELIAIPIDPLPMWAYQKNIEYTSISIGEVFKKITGGFSNDKK